MKWHRAACVDRSRARRFGVGARRKRSRFSAQYLACGLAAVLLATLVFPQELAGPIASPEETAAPTTCVFCGTPLAGADFCPHCGRLSRIVSTDSEHRFWGDVPYVLPFPPQENAPEIRSEISPSGLVSETVAYASGDRYEMKVEKKGLRIIGKVGWLKGGKETDYSAEMLDEFDATQRLTTRRITGELKGSPDTYLYRKLEFKYRQDGRLNRIEFTTSFYRSSSDWKKSPAAWLRHSQGEIVLRRDGAGALLKIETTVRDGRRSLRGEPEYGEPRPLVEFVIRDADRIVRVSRDQE